MAGLDPAIPLRRARPHLIIGIAGSSPAMTVQTNLTADRAQSLCCAAPIEEGAMRFAYRALLALLSFETVVTGSSGQAGQ
jgi:hypothetical protein